eukprot:scaffold28840_cov80-Phaeocystis_antarctica.AAC.1
MSDSRSASCRTTGAGNDLVMRMRRFTETWTCKRLSTASLASLSRSRGDIETAKKSDLPLLVLAVTLGKLLAFLRTTRSVTRARPPVDRCLLDDAQMDALRTSEAVCAS